MDETCPADAEPEVIFEVGRRLPEHIGRFPDATAFTNEAREMLRVTRRVESVARGARLSVGFQNADKLERELTRRLVANPATLQASACMHPRGRGREAEDVAGMTAFLVGGGASSTSGQVIAVDGVPSSSSFLRPWTARPGRVPDMDAFAPTTTHVRA